MCSTSPAPTCSGTLSVTGPAALAPRSHGTTSIPARDTIDRPLYGSGCTDPKQGGGILATAFWQHRCGSAKGLHNGSPPGDRMEAG